MDTSGLSSVLLPALAAAAVLAAPESSAAGASEAERTGERERAFSGEIRVGAEYDSNVAVLELDESSGERGTSVAGLQSQNPRKR